MGTYSGIEAHRKMNFDAVRNPVYRQAILEAVGPESVVLDLGAGLGMMGFIAAGAGARKVYLIEPEPIIELTRKIAEANDLRNIECIQAKIENLEISERADVIVSVFTGNFLLTEDLLPSLFYARDHFLAPGGKLIPDCSRMITAPVSAAGFYQENIEKWTVDQTNSKKVESYCVDYRLARPYLANSIYYDSSENIGAKLLAPPTCLLELNFMTATQAACDSSIELLLREDGELHGWLGWFEMRLGENWLSTGPDAEPTHWRPVFMPLENPVTVQAGQRIRLDLKRPEFGEWSWTTHYDGQQQRQSTFLSEPLTPGLLRKKSDAFQPKLNDRGLAMQFLLSQCNGNMNLLELADLLLVRFPDAFSSRQDALRFVKSLASKFE